MVTFGNTSLTPLKTDMMAARRRYVYTADGSRKVDHCVANRLMIQVQRAACQRIVFSLYLAFKHLSLSIQYHIQNPNNVVQNLSHGSRHSTHILSRSTDSHPKCERNSRLPR